MAEEHVSVQTEMGQVLPTNLSGPRRAKYVQLSLRHDPLTLSRNVPDCLMFKNIRQFAIVQTQPHPLCAAE